MTVLRKQLASALTGSETHIDFESALHDFPSKVRGVKPHGLPHTAWQLLEHMRIAQNDILEFSRNPNHQSPKFPEGYWPGAEAPPDDATWDASIRAFQKDARELKELTQRGDLFTPFQHGQGQTLLREILLVATHNSYHLGQLVLLKKMLLSGG
ncbi:MAG: DinB family protein [Acidobacteriaceae bacterium]|nr:DinB family protein [Acidobacteriaceae bacterium]